MCYAWCVYKHWFILCHIKGLGLFSQATSPLRRHPVAMTTCISGCLCRDQCSFYTHCAGWLFVRTDWRRSCRDDEGYIRTLAGLILTHDTLRMCPSTAFIITCKPLTLVELHHTHIIRTLREQYHTSVISDSHKTHSGIKGNICVRVSYLPIVSGEHQRSISTGVHCRRHQLIFMIHPHPSTLSNTHETIRHNPR